MNPHFNTLSSVVHEKLLTYLPREDLRQLNQVNKQMRNLILQDPTKRMLRYNREHLEALQERGKLTYEQQLKLQFLKFQDRVLWQRVTIVVGCLLFSPLIALYHSPAIAKYSYQRFLAPEIEKVALGVQCVYDEVIVPVAETLYEHAFIPTVNLIEKTVRLFFTTIKTSAVYLLKKVSLFFNGHLFHLLKETIQKCASFIFEHFVIPLLKQLGDILFELIKFSVIHILIPTFRTIDTVMNTLVNLQLRIARVVLPVVIPLFNIMKTIAEGLFVTFPLKVYRHIAAPLFSFLGSVLSTISEIFLIYLLIPVRDMALLGAKLLTEQVLLPAGRVILLLPQALYMMS
jgi:hypothetical protein